MSVYHVPHWFLEPEKHYLHNDSVHISPMLKTPRLEVEINQPSCFLARYEAGVVLLFNCTDCGGLPILGALKERIQL